jgi:TonB family protein
MTKRLLRHATAILALGAAIVAAHAEETGPRPEFASCPKPEWPRESLRFEQLGKVTMAFLIGEDGKVQDAVITETSGFPLLDAAALEGVAKCRFKPAKTDGKLQAAWLKMQYVWALEPESDVMTERDRDYAQLTADQKHAVVEGADRGEPDAIALLTSAAVLGDTTAQFWQGTRYEKGNGVPANGTAALFWYRKAATSGDPRAVEAVARLGSTAQPPAQ